MRANKKAEDKLDKLYSEYIRRRAVLRCGGCERCGAQKFDIQKDNGEIFPDWQQLQCAHLISRWHKATRFNEDASLGLCAGCHMWIDHEAEEKQALAVKFIGQERYDLLRGWRHPGKPDVAALNLYYKQQLALLGES